MGSIKCIGILTSGGDAPGMNAAIRAVTRSAIFNGLQVKGIYRGYKGLLTGEIKEFRTENVSNIIQLGGTILKQPAARNSRLLKDVRLRMKPCSEKVSTLWLSSVVTVH